MLAAYNPVDSVTMTQNLYFAGSTLWAFSSSYFFLGTYRVKAAKFDQVQEIKSLLKAAIVQAYNKEDHLTDDDTVPILASQVFDVTSQKRDFISLDCGLRSPSTRNILGTLSKISASSEQLSSTIHEVSASSELLLSIHEVS